jgi:ketosteroid isomerase-like protein
LGCSTMQHKNMRAWIFSILVLCFLWCFSIPDLAQEESGAAAIRVLESKWANAYRQRQITTLSSLLAEDYVITMEDGSTFGKVGFISYNLGALHVDIAEMSDLKIRMHGNVAVVTGAYHERGETHGKPYDYRDRFTDVWLKNGGDWQLIASHYSMPANL